MSLPELRKAIEQLTGHDIGGYEWECYSCHYHFSGHACDVCHIDPVKGDGEFDARGRPSGHDDLVERRVLLELLDNFGITGDNQ